MSDEHDHDAITEEVDEGRKTSFLELFFDLVIVYAITQVTGLLASDLTVGGFLRAGLVLGLVWWAWGIFTWAANAIALSGFKAQFVILLAAGGTFFVAQAIPDAFDGGGAWFAVAYLVVRALALVFYWFGLRGDRDQQQALRSFIPGASIAPFIVLIGGFVDQPARQWLFAAALAVDVASALYAARGGFKVSAAHFAERYGLIIIIALGEAVVAIGGATGGLKRDAEFFLGAAGPLLLAGLLWWGYFGWVGGAAEGNLRARAAHHRGTLARDLYTLLHFPMVAGIVAIAVAAKKVVAHPMDPLPDAGLVALGLGLGLYFAGFVGGHFRARGTVAWERVAAIVAVALACVVLQDADGVVVMFVVAAVVLATLLVEWRRVGAARLAARHVLP